MSGVNGHNHHPTTCMTHYVTSAPSVCSKSACYDHTSAQKLSAMASWSPLCNLFDFLLLSGISQRTLLLTAVVLIPTLLFSQWSPVRGMGMHRIFNLTLSCICISHGHLLLIYRGQFRLVYVVVGYGDVTFCACAALMHPDHCRPKVKDYEPVFDLRGQCDIEVAKQLTGRSYIPTNYWLDVVPDTATRGLQVCTASSALCWTVMVVDSCVRRLLCSHCAYLLYLACFAAAAAASKALHVVCTSRDAVLYRHDMCSYWHLCFRLLVPTAAGRQ